MESARNEKKKALISALKYVYVGLIDTVTFAYLSNYNIYIMTFLLLLTIIVSSKVFHGQLKIYKMEKDEQRTEEEIKEDEVMEQQLVHRENSMVVVCTVFCIIAIGTSMIFRT